MAAYVRADVRRGQLLEAGRAVLVRDGLDSLTLRAVAAEAGVLLGTLQYVFRTRADLVDALAEDVLGSVSYGRFEVGDGGLAHELSRFVDWYAASFLEDEAMLELIRHEYLATIGRVDPAGALDLPLRRRLIPGDYEARIRTIGQRSGEVYQRSDRELGRLWGVALAGLFLEFLEHRDLDRFRDDARLAVLAVVSLAQPAPADD